MRDYKGESENLEKSRGNENPKVYEDTGNVQDLDCQGNGLD
jgi:hypothetical protein